MTRWNDSVFRLGRQTGPVPTTLQYSAAESVHLARRWRRGEGRYEAYPLRDGGPAAGGGTRRPPRVFATPTFPCRFGD